jgi:nuclease-like protein
MRLTTNNKLIERQSKIARYTTFAGLGVLLVSLISSFVSIENILFAYLALFVGLALAYIGSTLANKWLREPRADNALAKALKGFDNKHHLYNYFLPASHVLTTPNGLLVFRVKPHEGEISFQAGKWKRARKFSRIFGGMGQEPLGDPVAELEAEMERMRVFLSGRLDDSNVIPIGGYVVFSDPHASLAIENAAMPVVRAEQLKETLRKRKRGPALQTKLYDDLERILSESADGKAA